MTYEPLTFELPELSGLSAEAIENHLGLYRGYVKHVNLVQEKIADLYKNQPDNTLAIGELQRHLGFEFCGMRNHEYYFQQFVGGSKDLSDSLLKEKIEKQWGSVANWQGRFRDIMLTRGIGWAMLYHDTKTNTLLQTWVDDHQLGQLAGLEVILAIDLWEHAYLRDYLSTDKGKYIDACLNNLNWEVSEQRMADKN